MLSPLHPIKARTTFMTSSENRSSKAKTANAKMILGANILLGSFQVGGIDDRRMRPPASNGPARS
jgi:hypothetical protein